MTTSNKIAQLARSCFCSANEQLVELDGLRVAHAQLSTQLTELSARNTLAEADSAALSDLNAQLLGHANPHQKIVQVAKIRQELTDIKKVHVQFCTALCNMTLTLSVFLV